MTLETFYAKAAQTDGRTVAQKSKSSGNHKYTRTQRAEQL